MLSISYSPDGSSDSYFQWEVVAPLRGGTGRALQGAMSRCYGAVSLSKLVHGIWGLCWRDFLDFRTSAVWFCSEMFCQNVLGLKWWRGLCCLCELSVAAISLFLPCPAMQLHWFYGRCALECKRICFHEAGDLVFCELSHFP